MRQAGENIRIRAFDPLMEDDFLPLLHSFFPDGQAGGTLETIITQEEDGSVKARTTLISSDFCIF